VTRWWDGYQWTAHTQATAAPATVQPGSVQYPRVPEGTPVYTRWTWWIVFLPFAVTVPAIGYLAETPARVLDFLRWSLTVMEPDGRVDPSYGAEALRRQMDLIFTPWYLATILVAIAAVGITIWFSYLDHRDLRRLGYVRPFHWAWSLLGLAGYGIVYIIGRSVVVRRRSGRGLAPLWVSIALYVVGFVSAIVWALWFLAYFSDQMIGILSTVSS
jgi:uncharacterized membrane protein YqaE (UPF0057 family)